MPCTLILGFIGFGFSEILAGLGIVVLLAGVAGTAYYSFRSKRNKVRDDATKEKADAAKEWQDVANATKEKLALLDLQLKAAAAAHAACEEQINSLTQFNLRLQSRERGYQRGINKLELRLGLEATDWNDITDAPSFGS